MRIIQISDIHISRPGERPNNIDVRENFLRALASVARENPDAVVLTGDLCLNEPDGNVYKWIADELSLLDCTVHVVPGNHDDQTIMPRYFDCPYNQKSNEIYYRAEWEGRKALFLDTGRSTLSEMQYDWLKNELRDTESQYLIFMHHPPAYCGVPHMDGKYAFGEIPRLQRLLRTADVQIIVFCGHYHVERAVQFANQEIVICPSTYFQIDASQTEFAIEHSTPGYRLIELSSGGVLDSRCVYVE